VELTPKVTSMRSATRGTTDATHRGAKSWPLTRPPLIYYILEHPDYLSSADELFGAIDSAAAQGMTSVLTLHEVLVKPLREGRQDLAQKYKQVLTSSANVRMYDIDQVVCETSARLRAKYVWLRTPDALQLATAIKHEAQVVMTNDDRWRLVSETVVLLLKDFATT
jgi:predicted nucleic acid-binding protein